MKLLFLLLIATSISFSGAMAQNMGPLQNYTPDDQAGLFF